MPSIFGNDETYTDEHFEIVNASAMTVIDTFWADVQEYGAKYRVVPYEIYELEQSIVFNGSRMIEWHFEPDNIVVREVHGWHNDEYGGYPTIDDGDIWRSEVTFRQLCALLPDQNEDED